MPKGAASLMLSHIVQCTRTYESVWLAKNTAQEAHHIHIDWQRIIIIDVFVLATVLDGGGLECESHPTSSSKWLPVQLTTVISSVLNGLSAPFRLSSRFVHDEDEEDVD